MGSEATESVSETEAVQKVMEKLLKTQEELRKVKMRTMLNDCQRSEFKGISNKIIILKGTRFGINHMIPVHGGS